MREKVERQCNLSCVKAIKDHDGTLMWKESESREQ